MRRKEALALILSLALLLSACGGTPEETKTPAGTETEQTSGETVSSGYSEELFSNRDFETEYDDSKCAHITLKGDSAETDSDAVQISGSTVTITDEGTYVISGTLDNGMIIVDSEKNDKTQIVLNGVTIHSETSAAIYVLQSDKVFITLAEGSENTLSNGGSFEAIDENNIDAVIFSKEDLTLNGSGSLTITSPAGHGVVSKDELTVTGGSYEITCASHGLTGKDNVCISSADLVITAGKDGIHAENSDDESLGFVYIESGAFNISAEGDGIDAGNYLMIDGGSFNITAGGGSVNAEAKSSDSWGGFMGGGRGQGGMGGKPTGSSTPSSSEDSTSMKGMKSGADLTINTGSFHIDSADDAIHSNTSASINGGTFEIASGDDAVHAEDTLTITSCTMNVSECYEGLEAENIYVQGGEFLINASDDGLNASGGTDSSGTTGGRDGMFGGGGFGGSAVGNIEISGGKLTIYAGGDGLDSNGDLLICGGYTMVFNPKSGDTSVLDSQNSPVITGGTYIGLGITTNMAETFSTSESTQGVIACTIGNQSAGAEITIADADGNSLISCTTEYSTVLMIVSSPDIVKGESYNVTAGSVSGTVSAS